jgi:hypothetical protein
VLHHGEHRAVVQLQQCTGQPIERIESDDRAVIAYLEGVESDLDLVEPSERCRARRAVGAVPTRPA